MPVESPVTVSSNFYVLRKFTFTQEIVPINEVYVSSCSCMLSCSGMCIVCV